MQGKSEFVLLAVNTTFGGASARAMKLAEQTGIEIRVRSGLHGFEIWGPTPALNELDLHLREIDGNVLEVCFEEEEEDPESQLERLRADQLESEDLINANTHPSDFTSTRHSSSPSGEDSWDDIANDLDDERENWGACGENGWFYRE